MAHPDTLPRNGMPIPEFRQAMLGILPDTILYNENVSLIEKLYQIEGNWGFDFRDGLLMQIYFSNFPQVNSPVTFQTWIGSVKHVIEDFTRSFGRPETQMQGEAKYFDHNRPSFANPAQRRHVFQEATWSIAGTEIRIICELKSNRADDAPDTQYGDSYEYWNYDFRIDIETNTTPAANAPLINGRFYLGMPIDAFSARFPDLFPHGTAPSGQWGKSAEWHGLQGEWSYVFIHGKLGQTQFNAYFQNPQVNETSFQTCRKAALAIINDFKNSYGKPNETYSGPSKLVASIRKKNTYQEVETAQWNAVDGMRIRVEFQQFDGESQTEALLFTVSGTDRIFAGIDVN